MALENDAFCFETTKLLREQFNDDTIEVRRTDDNYLSLSMDGNDRFQIPITDSDTPEKLSIYFTGAIQGFDVGFELGFMSAVNQLMDPDFHVEG